ncbi:Endonuclease/Exonuclease/phosphatase family protein [Hartmannibacter diazotrophicus]|uniref:Endonuclease/Exonuclease/phosphatase family protein n=1 Tax=Hartmannibacter diazotrophicus TaxID=1482074 RepID=A0A2C9D671_9HYPH|nr:endonuclease/exonuclease/phosphatase family protein [Hartmannibacter diazotrophicus]SON55690.1 Endonuclease/Exonuclease/phosphatase family protein [Hartmannibacter diazotrophicus]
MTDIGPLPRPVPPASIRLMTWNIHGGIGPDGVFDLDRIAALIEKHAPDLVALQEVDTRGRGPQALARLHGIHGPSSGHRAEAHTITAEDGDYGNVLLSRWPLVRSARHDLSHANREPRMAIETVVDGPHGPLRLIAVHLGLAITERARQARQLQSIAETAETAPTVMLGDFNDWFFCGKVRRTMAKILPLRTRLATFPAALPQLRLDRIYCARPLRLCAVWTDREARHCSDHLPVIADISLR